MLKRKIVFIYIFEFVFFNYRNVIFINLKFGYFENFNRKYVFYIYVYFFCFFIKKYKI